MLSVKKKVRNKMYGIISSGALTYMHKNNNTHLTTPGKLASGYGTGRAVGIKVKNIINIDQNQ